MKQLKKKSESNEAIKKTQKLMKHLKISWR